MNHSLQEQVGHGPKNEFRGAFESERLNSLMRSNEENLSFLTLCFNLRLRFEIGILNKNKIALDSKIGKKDQRLHNGFGSDHGQ